MSGYTIGKMIVATLAIHLHIPGCGSLKEKRSYIKPLIARLRREFNLSVAEIDLQDKWQEAVIGCVMVGSDTSFLQSAMQTVLHWVEANWREGDVIDQRVEIIA